MFYRADTLQQFNLTVPQTWDEVLEAARAVHMNVDTDGDGKGDMLGACFALNVGPLSSEWGLAAHAPQPACLGGTSGETSCCVAAMAGPSTHVLLAQCRAAGQCAGSFLLLSTAASYIQSSGTASGLFLDPTAVPPRPLADNQGMLTALRFWRDIMQFSKLSTTCTASSPDFQAGRCLLTITWSVVPWGGPCEGSQGGARCAPALRCRHPSVLRPHLERRRGNEFKATRSGNVSKPGMVGVAPIPGSTHVVDRTTGELVKCTQRLCPYGKAYTNPRTGEQVRLVMMERRRSARRTALPRKENRSPCPTCRASQGWVNTSPFPAFGGWTAAVSAFSTSARQLSAYKFFTFMTNAANSWEDVLDERSGVDPVRDDHLTSEQHEERRPACVVALLEQLCRVQVSLRQRGMPCLVLVTWSQTWTGGCKPATTAASPRATCRPCSSRSAAATSPSTPAWCVQPSSCALCTALRWWCIHVHEGACACTAAGGRRTT